MKFLLDEQLSPAAATSLDALGEDFGSFEHILSSQKAGTADEDIPPICKARGIDALITVNVKDFGAKKLYYEALLTAGVSVFVLRPGKVHLDALAQVGLVTRHLRRGITLLSAKTEPILIVASQTEARDRTIADLVAEFD